MKTPSISSGGSTPTMKKSRGRTASASADAERDEAQVEEQAEAAAERRSSDDGRERDGDAERDDLPAGLVALFPQGPASRLTAYVGRGVHARRRTSSPSEARVGAPSGAATGRRSTCRGDSRLVVGDREVAEPARGDQHPGLQGADRLVVVARRRR